jgi:type III pantothenate kinase
MLLVADVGNTNIVIGVWDETRLVHRFRITTRLEATSDEYRSLLQSLLQPAQLAPNVFDGAILSSVVPPLIPRIEKVVEQVAGHEPLVVGPGIKTGLNILYEDPREVGADRIVNCVAALSLHEAPLIVVDFGTATTFDVVVPPADYLGGAIAPGIEISREALAERTARLPRVELALPEAVVGRTTVESIRSGILWGHGAMVDGLIARIEAECGIQAKVIATGGFGELMRRASSRLDQADPNLTLLGLRLLWERNR